MKEKFIKLFYGEDINNRFWVGLSLSFSLLAMSGFYAEVSSMETNKLLSILYIIICGLLLKYVSKFLSNEKNWLNTLVKELICYIISFIPYIVFFTLVILSFNYLGIKTYEFRIYVYTSFLCMLVTRVHIGIIGFKIANNN